MTMPAINAQVEDYLVSRRAMGFDLRGEGYQLHAFARFANEQSDAGTLTLELLLRWVQGAVSPGPVTAARRVEVLRPFLKYCRQFDPVCPVLPLGLCGPGHRRLSPHIYTEAEVTALLVAAGELKPDGLRPLTYVTLFGLLAATGMRLSEALHLERKDLNLDQPSLTVRETKFKKSRLVPIHATHGAMPWRCTGRLPSSRRVTQGLRRSSSHPMGSRFRSEPSITSSTVSAVAWAGLPAAAMRSPVSTICATPSSARHCCVASRTTRSIMWPTPSRLMLDTRKFPTPTGTSPQPRS